MLSRIGRVIFDHSEGIGLAFMWISFFWMMAGHSVDHQISVRAPGNGTRCHAGKHEWRRGR